MQDYDQFAKTFSKSRQNMRWQDLDEIIDDIAYCKYKTVLDIGCGNGRFVEFFEKKYEAKTIKYTGIDASNEMILEAQKMHPKRDFFVGDMSEEKSYYFEETFDAIVAIASFHHLKDIESRHKTLDIWRDILSEEGKIYLTNWNLLEQQKYQSSHLGGGDFAIKISEFSRYYHGFTLDELADLFTQANLNIEKNIRGVNGYNLVSWVGK